MPRKAVSKKKSPAFDLVLDAETLPDGMSEKSLIALFSRAWEEVPAARRPETEGVTRLALDVHVISDAEIATLNAQHMKHKGPTDVLSFPMGNSDPERDAFHLGEIVVSLDTARREAAARKLPEAEELSRYILHGFLHLLGYDDDTGANRKAMFKVQEAILASQLS